VHAVVSIGLLIVAVAGLLTPRLRQVQWLVPVVLAGVAVAGGIASAAVAWDAVRPLLAPLAFVLLAVPMAVMLDRYGLFEELAQVVAGGRRYLGGLWVLAALVTALLNLDAAVVLLSPLYVRIAERREASRLALALQPALLSGLASSALPISNLTNLIAVGRLHLSTWGFVEHLGLPTAVASGVGWLAYRASLGRIVAAEAAIVERAPELGREAPREPARPRSRTILVGGVFVIVVVAGFLVLPSFGGAPWEVAGAGDLVLAVLTRSVPWRVAPLDSAGTVLGLGVLASAAARHLPVAHLLHGSTPLDTLGVSALSAGVANAVNNLPAVLVALPGLGHGPSWGAWAVLLGTNVGPLLVPSGSLAVLLWLATVRRLGLEVHDRDYLRLGWRIGLPSFAAGLGALVLVRLALGASH